MKHQEIRHLIETTKPENCNKGTTQLAVNIFISTHSKDGIVNSFIGNQKDALVSFIGSQVQTIQTELNDSLLGQFVNLDDYSKH